MQLLFFVVPLVAEFSLALQAHMTWSVHTLQKVYKLGVFTTTPQLQSLRCSSVYICFTVLLLLFFSSSYFFSTCCGSFVPVQSGPDTNSHETVENAHSKLVQSLCTDYLQGTSGPSSSSWSNIVCAESPELDYSSSFMCART